MENITAYWFLSKIDSFSTMVSGNIYANYASLSLLDWAHFASVQRDKRTCVLCRHWHSNAVIIPKTVNTKYTHIKILLILKCFLALVIIKTIIYNNFYKDLNLFLRDIHIVCVVRDDWRVSA